MQYLILISIVINLIHLINSKPSLINQSNDDLELIILHNNDMHARFEQTSRSTSKCLPEDAANDKCYGGFARTAHEIRKYRTEAASGGLPVLYFNAGDTYTGTAWFTVYRDNITSAFLNLLKPDAISLGNHEFDEGVAGLLPFLDNVNFPVLSANLDLSKCEELANIKSLKNSTIFTINNVKIGVIGYLTPDTKNAAIKNTVEYIEETVAINAEAKKLKNEGVNIIIALGHSGYRKDKEIAKKCPEVDLVVGGHTDTFLYNGVKPDAEDPEGPYPTVIKQSSGKLVPVVQAYGYTKYLGKIQLKFDKKGNLKSWEGQPILLNATVPEDSDVLALLDVYRPNITAYDNKIVGYTKVPLQGGAAICRREECNLGNLIADALVHSRAMEIQNNSVINQNAWTDASIAFIQGGGVRTSIDKRPDGSITLGDILTVLPFHNDNYMVTLTGKDIREALEHSASVWGKDSNGAFLQVSGVQVVYDMSKKENERLKNVKVLCAECIVPKYSDLVDEKLYNVLMNSFIFEGGDGFNFNNAQKGNQKLKAKDAQSLVDYLTVKSPVYPGIEWRITIEHANVKPDPNSTIKTKTGSGIFVMLGVMLSRLF